MPVNTETSANEILRVRSRKGGMAAVFVLFCRKWRRVLNQGSAPLHSRSSFKSRMPECQSGDAGANPADRTNFLRNVHSCTAGASLRSRASKTPRARGSTETPCHFQWAARLVSKSAGLHPAVREAQPRRSTIFKTARPPASRPFPSTTSAGRLRTWGVS